MIPHLCWSEYTSPDCQYSFTMWYVCLSTHWWHFLCHRITIECMVGPFPPPPGQIPSDISILITDPWNLPQMLLGGIWRIFRRACGDWKSGNYVVSWTTPSGLTLWFWLLYSFCRSDISHSDLPNYTYCVSEVLDGVGRPGKSHWPPLVSWPPTYSPIHLLFAPGTPQMLSLSFTTYLHTTSTFLDSYNHWSLLTLHLSSSPLPSLFWVFGLSETLSVVY